MTLEEASIASKISLEKGSLGLAVDENLYFTSIGRTGSLDCTVTSKGEYFVKE